MAVPFWGIIAILAALLNAGMYVTQKYVLKDKVTPFAYLMVIGIMNFMYASTVFLVSDISGPLFYRMLPLIGGFIAAIGNMALLTALKKEEVTRVIPILAVAPLFITFLAAFIVNEIFPPLIYVSIIFMVLGAFLLSFRFDKGLPKRIDAIGFIVFALVLFSIQGVTMKLAFTGIGYSSVLFYQFAGYFLGTSLLWFHKTSRIDFFKIYKGFNSNLKLVLLAEFFGILNFLALAYAISLGPVSLVSSLYSTQTLFVLLFTFTITKFKPHLIAEEFEKGVGWIKLFAVFFILTGTFIIIA